MNIAPAATGSKRSQDLESGEAGTGGERKQQQEEKGADEMFHAETPWYRGKGCRERSCRRRGDSPKNKPQSC